MIVVDTNILVYRLLSGEKNEQARSLVRLDADWAAPLLWRSELRNVLSGFLRRRSMTPATAEETIARGFRCLLAGEHAAEDRAVFDLVQQSNCTSYDCEFVAVAMALDSFLVTEDHALLRNFPGRCCSLAQAIAGNLR